MAINHGSSWEAVSPANSNPITIPVTPAVAPKGGLVFVAHGEASADRVSGVTWGGVAMTRKVTIADTTGSSATQLGRSYIYALEGNVPAGSQNVVVTRTGTEILHVSVWSQVGNQPMEVISTASVSEVGDPTVALTRSGRSSLAYLVLFSGANAAAGLGIPAGFSRGPDHDFADYCSAVFREFVPSTADGSKTITQADANSALCAIVVSEAVPPPPPSGDSDHLCGWECGITVPDVLGLPVGHWHTGGTTPPTIDTTRARYGSRAARFNPVNSTSFQGRFITGTVRWERAYFFFDGVLPDRDTVLWRAMALAGYHARLRFRLATTDIVAELGASGPQTTAVPVLPNVRYRVELLADVGANPRTVQMRVCTATQADPEADGPSVSLGTASFAEAASTFTEFRIGAACGAVATANVVIDDHKTGGVAAGYPAGPSTILGMQVVSDGTHSYNAAGDFRSASADLGLGVTDAWTRLIGLLVDDNSLLQVSGAASGEYLELQAGGAPVMTSISAVEVVSVHRGASIAAHKQTLRWLKAAGSVDVFTDADFSELSLLQHSKHYLTLPDGTALSTANLNASKFRHGSSWTSVLTGGQILGLMLEVDGTLTAPPNPPPVSEENPVHTYAEPGTYTVTLTVRDNDGFTATVSHQVTVPSEVAHLAGLGTLGALLTRRGTIMADMIGFGEVTADFVGTTLTLQIRENGVLRVDRPLPIVPAVPGESTRYQMLITAEERALFVNWNNAQPWLIADGGTQAVRVTRLRLLPP